ncbi:hypothetical protein PIB30_079223 [Stylosanthes scabra]|uniref:Uncharacterized protein n=1 Tax=Stylosanthes scabra TaxID=79078 RepID=A0ABU6ZPM1_9FABA|nr:hypothetical protein [Stylosanthes scabra]
MACFSYVVLFAFFLLSSHLFARQLPNEKRFSISNKPLWAMPLTPTKITKAHSTAPSYGYYSRDSNLDSNPILPMLLFSKRKKPKEQLKTKTSPKTPPHQHKPPDQNPKTHHEHNPPHHEQVPLPHHPHHPYNPYNDYNDPPNYYERPRPFGSNLPPIGSIIEPFLRKPNQEDPESEDTDLESKKTDPKSKKNPPSNEEGEDSLDNTAHLIGYYLPLGFENFAVNHEDGNVVWHHKMNSPSDIYWRTTHSFPTKISP